MVEEVEVVVVDLICARKAGERRRAEKIPRGVRQVALVCWQRGNALGKHTKPSTGPLGQQGALAEDRRGRGGKRDSAPALVQLTWEREQHGGSSWLEKCSAVIWHDFLPPSPSIQ